MTRSPRTPVSVRLAYRPADRWPQTQRRSVLQPRRELTGLSARGTRTFLNPLPAVDERPRSSSSVAQDASLHPPALAGTTRWEHLTPASLNQGVTNARSGPGSNHHRDRAGLLDRLRFPAVPVWTGWRLCRGHDAPTNHLPGKHRQAARPRSVYGRDDVLADLLGRLFPERFLRSAVGHGISCRNDD